MELQYSIVRKNRRKTASIEVSSNGRVTVKVPWFLSDDRVAQLVAGKSRWIQKTLDRHTEMRERGKQKLISDEGEIVYLGAEYQLLLEDGLPATIELGKHSLRVRGPVAAEDTRDARSLAFVLVGWYKARALEYTVERARYFSGILGVQFNGIKVRSMRSRWGSCTSRGNISFDWRLITVRPSVVDYVVVHELCHLVHPNHSREFWTLVESILPDYKARVKHLKEVEKRFSIGWDEGELPCFAPERCRNRA